MLIASVLLALVASALSAPQQFAFAPQQFAPAPQQFAPAPQPARPVAIVTQDTQLNPDGSYLNKYTSENGISVDNQGFLKATNDKTDVVVAQQGRYSFTSPEGVLVSVAYVADEYGTHIIDQQPAVAVPQRF